MARETVTDDERKFFYAGKKLPTIYLAYLNYLRTVRRLSVGTIQNRKIESLRFILKNPKCNSARTVKSLRAVDVQEYTIEVAARMTSRHLRRNLVIVLRDFFRFLHFEQYTKKDLSSSVPTVTTYRHSSVPKGFPWKVVEQLLKVPNRRTFCGKRDYAVILMLSRYGIRAIQLRALRLQDIDWQKNTIHFKACKGGKDVLAPLLPDVRRSLKQYFRAGRMKASREFDQVFLTSGTKGSSEMGQRPLRDSTWNIVANAFKKLGAETQSFQKRGPHAIRHAYAVNRRATPPFQEIRCC